jgi:GNAT superfamily N-acetyltransferase
LRVRAANAHELLRLQEIEVAAGQRFIEVGMPEIAAGTPSELTALRRALDAGLLFVAEDPEAGAVGFAWVRPLKASAHLEELSVLPSFGRRGAGAALLEHAARTAAELGYDQLTLSTFAHVPWNAPFYARRGFGSVPEADLPPELAALRRREAETGLPVEERIIMSLALPNTRK